MPVSGPAIQHCPTLASALEELQNDLAEVKVLLEKVTRKRVHDALTNKMQQKSQKKPELHDSAKPAAVVAPITIGYTVKISNYEKFVKIYITLTGVHQNVQVYFTERSFDFLVKNLNGKGYSMILNNLLKPISVEGSSKKKIKTDTVLILCREKAENPSYDAETDPSKGLMNLLKKIYEDGDDDMKQKVNKAWKQTKGDTEF
uniref:Calcyclin-binding protein n=1 Tax=Cavia porcellus TaxID=10141 RepID=A0A286XLW3_CAVPO